MIARRKRFNVFAEAWLLVNTSPATVALSRRERRDAARRFRRKGR